jgi:hypothetical protein
MTPAYVAGLIDGEGCISIYESKGRTFYHSVTVGMTAKALPILEQLQEKYGGNLTLHRKATDRWDAAHTWSAHGDLATVVLEDVLPHLILKEEQARVALRVAEIRASLPARWMKPDADQRARKWTPGASDRCAILKRRMHELNAKGPQEPSTSSLDGRSPIARLVAGVWVTDQSDLLSDLGWESFRGTWPRSGSMRTGRLYRRPAWVPPISASVGSALPTPRASRGASSTETVALLPTPVADNSRGLPSDGTDFQSLPNALVALMSAEIPLLATPLTTSATGVQTLERQVGGRGSDVERTTLTDATVRQPARWGEYEPAVRRWESLTRPAPEPTKPNAKGNPKLSDEFDEWLMGYPAGWITDIPGVTWNETLKACGNGVVPQQGAAAVRWLIAMSAVA